MRLRNMVAAGAGALVLVVPATAMGATLIGNFADGNNQAANSNQTGINTSGGAEFSAKGEKFISGDSTPKLTQSSTNMAENNATIGGSDGTLIGDGNQLNTQGINSEQGAKKGSQTSTNVERGTQLIGLSAGDAIIGSPSQVSAQGENSTQFAQGASGAVTTFIGGTPNKAPLTQTSLNIVDSCEVVIGGGAGGC